MTNTILPPRLGIEYLPHQIDGVRWMIEREAADAPMCRGGVLADDMGLGKTFQTIGLLLNGLSLRTLIVCPPALIASWTDELRACGFDVRVLLGTAAWTAVARVAAPNGSIYLTTYPKLTLYRRFLRDEAFARVILDEGHVIRNGRGTARGAAAAEVAAVSECRWILSATPVQNSHSDWRNLCAWLHCGGGGDPAVILLRRTMEELRGIIETLPPPPRFIQHSLRIPAVGASASESRLFRALCDQLASAMDSHAVSALMKLELYLRIQQFLVHPQIYIESMRNKFRTAYPRPDWTGTATKWTACSAVMLRGIAAEEAQIVFCNFRAEIEMVASAAREAGAHVAVIAGGLGPDAVRSAVEGARSAATDGEAVVVVVQIVAGGAGLNLQFCRRVLFLSQHWNPAVVHQAVGRAVRIGQRFAVEVHMFHVVDDVMDNLDRRMLAVHSAKIGGARVVCASFYAGYAPLSDMMWEEKVESPPAADEDPVAC